MVIQNQLPERKAGALEEVTRFNEREVLEDHSSYIVRALEVPNIVHLRNSNNCLEICIHIQLEEVWIEDVGQSTDKKVKEECIPGKPMSVFVSDPHKVLTG